MQIIINTYLDRINWTEHDGVHLPMINDFLRNQFYCDIMVDNVQDKNCLDIGFGTGLLSILALQYGAKSIIAYESDPFRFQLGREIINSLNLKDKIHLINKKYNHTMLAKHPDVNLIYHEVVDNALWGEGLFNCIPRQYNNEIQFLPGEYFVEIYAEVVTKEFAEGLLTNAGLGFNPGVPTNTEFVNLINQFLMQKYEAQTIIKDKQVLQQGIMHITHTDKTFWGWQAQLKVMEYSNTSLVASYSVNVVTNTIITTDTNRKQEITNINFTNTIQQLIIDTTEWVDKIVLLVPRCGLRHQDHQMLLDSGHWGPTPRPVLLIHPTSDLIITHDLNCIDKETGIKITNI